VSRNYQRNLSPLDALVIHDYFKRRGNIMATMISEVYDAFIASGAPEDKARRAAEAMAAYDGRFNKIEGDLG
jgi:phosphate uptake regulator